jgi:hypothetical protein
MKTMEKGQNVARTLKVLLEADFFSPLFGNLGFIHLAKH